MEMKFRGPVFPTDEGRNIQRKEVKVTRVKTEGRRCGGEWSDQEFPYLGIFVPIPIPILVPNINILIPPPKLIYILLICMFVKK